MHSFIYIYIYRERERYTGAQKAEPRKQRLKRNVPGAGFPNLPGFCSQMLGLRT